MATWCAKPLDSESSEVVRLDRAAGMARGWLNSEWNQWFTKSCQSYFVLVILQNKPSNGVCACGIHTHHTSHGLLYIMIVRVMLAPAADLSPAALASVLDCGPGCNYPSQWLLRVSVLTDLFNFLTYQR